MCFQKNFGQSSIYVFLLVLIFLLQNQPIEAENEIDGQSIKTINEPNNNSQNTGGSNNKNDQTVIESDNNNTSTTATTTNTATRIGTLQHLNNYRNAFPEPDSERELYYPVPPPAPLPHQRRQIPGTIMYRLRSQQNHSKIKPKLKYQHQANHFNNYRNKNNNNNKIHQPKTIITAPIIHYPQYPITYSYSLPQPLFHLDLDDDHHFNYFSHRFRPQIQLIDHHHHHLLRHHNRKGSPGAAAVILRRTDEKRNKLVNSLVNRASQAFQNLVEHAKNRSRPRLVKLMSDRRLSGGTGGKLSAIVRERLLNRPLNNVMIVDQPHHSTTSGTSLSSTASTSDKENHDGDAESPTSSSSSSSSSSSTSASSSSSSGSSSNGNDGDNIQYAESRVDNVDDNQRNLSPATNKTKNIDYEQEGKKLRQDIVEKVGHIQTILNTAFEVSRERRDLILSRILSNTNNRLERAKMRADQILSEPSTSELAVKTLHHLNSGVNQISSFLQGLMNRINISIQVQMKNPKNGNQNTTHHRRLNDGTSQPNDDVKQQEKEN